MLSAEEKEQRKELKDMLKQELMAFNRQKEAEENQDGDYHPEDQEICTGMEMVEVEADNDQEVIVTHQREMVVQKVEKQAGFSLGMAEDVEPLNLIQNVFIEEELAETR